MKRTQPVWRVAGRIAVRASSGARGRGLLSELLAALRLADAPGVRLVARASSAAAFDRVGKSWRAPLRLNSSELVAVAGWPIGATTGLPIERTLTKALPPTERIASRGRVVGVSTFAGKERPIALRTRDGLHHLHVLGPTGVGKSTLLLNLIGFSHRRVTTPWLRPTLITLSRLRRVPKLPTEARRTPFDGA